MSTEYTHAHHRNAVAFVLDWQQRHPYLFSLLLALVITIYLLFFTLSIEMTEEDLLPVDNIEFIDIDKIRTEAPRRITRREVSTNQGEVDPNSSPVDRAQGTSDDPNAVDLSFHPNIVPPKPIGRLKKLYPREAAEQGVEAQVVVELLIASNGRVKAARVLGIRLSKELPPDLHARLAKAFYQDAMKILKGVRYTPPVVQGKQVPVKFEQRLKFRLND